MKLECGFGVLLVKTLKRPHKRPLGGYQLTSDYLHILITFMSLMAILKNSSNSLDGALSCLSRMFNRITVSLGRGLGCCIIFLALLVKCISPIVNSIYINLTTLV